MLLFLLLLSPAKAGDAARGQALFEDHRTSLCLLCHANEANETGNLAPTLKGLNLTEDDMRARIMDMRNFNKATLMPPFYVSEGLSNVALRFTGKPILTRTQIDDLVAFLMVYR